MYIYQKRTSWESEIMSSMHPRRNARKGVLEALFAQQFSEEKPKLVLERILNSKPDRKKNSEFIHLLFFCVMDNIQWADELIKSHLQNWEFDRVAKIDRLLLRMGICEIFFINDIPPKVSISEMVEISKVYSTDESPSFINGVLDAVYKDYQLKEDS